MRRYARAIFGCTLISTALGGCAKTNDGGGGAGSETHWLASCEKSADCEVGECLANLCTVACESVRDCPAPLDTCQTSNSADEDRKLCLSSDPGRSEQALTTLPAPASRATTACDQQRPSEVRLTDLGSPDGANAASLPPVRIAVDRRSGFLAFGGDASVHRLDSRGRLVRTLPSPSASKPVLDDLAVLDDGAVLLAGRVEGWAGDVIPERPQTRGRGWIGKVDSDWNLLWEQTLELLPLEVVNVEPLPDGGAIVAGVKVPYANTDGNTVFWARYEADGRERWQFGGAVGLPNQTTLLSSGFLSLSGETARVVMQTGIGVAVFTVDLNGLVHPSDLRDVSVPVHDVQSLPDGRWAVLCSDALLLMDGTEVAWQRSFTAGTQVPRALAYDATRSELMVTGGVFDQDDDGLGSWLSAWDLDGNQTWELARKPWPLTPNARTDGAAYGEMLDDVAVDSGGNTLALRPQWTAWLNSLWVGTETCR